MTLILFLLASAGMTLVITSGSIFQPLRVKIMEAGWQKTIEFLTCSQCVGFHSGWFMGLLINPCDHLSLGGLFACACASSLFSMVADLLINYIGSVE